MKNLLLTLLSRPIRFHLSPAAVEAIESAFLSAFRFGGC